LEHFDTALHKGRKPSFDAVPRDLKCRLFGVDYVHLKGRQSGDFFLTRHGWALADSLGPEHWLTGNKFSKVGRALAGATGAVYRVPVPHPLRRDFAIVVKFSRFCQSTGDVVVELGPDVSQARIERIKRGRFLAPFEEFGNLMQLRAASAGSIPTKTPLGIYCPPTRYLDWQLGRESYLKSLYSRKLLADQGDVPPERRIDYDWERQYILLYRWIDGIDAEQAAETGMISEAEMVQQSRNASARLKALGWEVLDHKPRHVILRVTRDGRWVARRGAPLWALIDYELLYPCAPEDD